MLRKKEIEIEREQFNLDKERGKVWPKEEGKSIIHRFANIFWRELEKIMLHELPPRDDGLSATEIVKIHRARLKTFRSSVEKILA